MILFPAIDLKDGKCVRLKLGEMDAATVFNDDPAAQARDLRGAGLPVAAHRRSQRRLRRQAGQRRGGRGHPRRASPCRCSSAAASATWRRSRPGSTGASRRVILGTVAVRDPGARARRLRAISRPRRRRHRRQGRQGRGRGLGRDLRADRHRPRARFEDAGVAAIIYTDIDRDGMLEGLNLEATAELARATRIPVIASGGLASIDDVQALLRPEYADARRRHHRPRALRRPHRPGGGAQAVSKRAEEAGK